MKKHSFTGFDLPTDCPFCGKGLAASERPLSIMHAMPPCKTFNRLDALEFVTAVNNRAAKELGMTAELEAERKKFDQEHNQ